MSGDATPDLSSGDKRPWNYLNETIGAQALLRKRAHTGRVETNDTCLENFRDYSIPNVFAQTTSLTSSPSIDLNDSSSYRSGHALLTTDTDSTCVGDGDTSWMHDTETTATPVDTLGQSPEAEICFGMLPGIQVRIDKTFGSVQASQLDEQSSDDIILDLEVRGLYCNIILPSGKSIAILNLTSFRLLNRCQEDLALRFQASVPLSAWYQQVESSEADTSPRHSKIDILVFGYQNQADAVAAKLAENKFYLQDPEHVPKGYQYHNPQALDLPDGMPQLKCLPAYTDAKEHHTANGAVPLAISNAEVDYDKLLDIFSCSKGLIEVTAVAQVSSTLLSHQKEGLDFVMQRELNTLSPSQNLWELKQEAASTKKHPIFQHIITGARSRAAKSCLGGLIADDTGLGKSLTMLSAIVGSLQRAITYAQMMTTIDARGQGVIAAKSTLVLVPSALLIDNWIGEVTRHLIPGTLSFYKFHGKARNIDYPNLCQYDIIFTTYGTVAADYWRKRSLLHEIQWYRIVLDEAHAIRNSSTKQFRAINSLTSFIRWGLTATPIQNSLDDLGSLMRFLKLPILEEPAQFKRHIMGPIEQTTPKDYSNLTKLLGAVCLRRTKAVLSLDPVTYVTHSVDFDQEERVEYARIERVCRDAFDLAVSGHKVKEAHQTVLEILLRLRLFCNNGTTHNSANGSLLEYDPTETLSLIQQRGEAICHFCSCDIAEMQDTGDRGEDLVTPCNRVVCVDCIPIWTSESSERDFCSICSKQHSMNTATIATPQYSITNGKYPSKMLALYEDILAHKDNGKCVVFSFWKRSLDIAGDLLTEKGIAFLRVDGSVSSSRRKVLLEQFQKQCDMPVLLMTLGTGAVGLNGLSVANRVHLLEPQWNPSVESQAIGRVVRLGQKLSVTVVRYLVNRTVEKNVQSKQLRKLNLAHGGFTRGKSEDMRTRLQLLQELILDT